MLGWKVELEESLEYVNFQSREMVISRGYRVSVVYSRGTTWMDKEYWFSRRAWARYECDQAKAVGSIPATPTIYEMLLIRV